MDKLFNPFACCWFFVGVMFPRCVAADCEEFKTYLFFGLCREVNLKAGVGYPDCRKHNVHSHTTLSSFTIRDFKHPFARCSGSLHASKSSMKIYAALTWIADNSRANSSTNRHRKICARFGF